MRKSVFTGLSLLVLLVTDCVIQSGRAVYESCSVGESCVAGTSCSAVGRGAVSAVLICTATCTAGGICPAGGACVVAAGSAAGQCFRPCAAGACGAGNTCQAGADGVTMICLPSGATSTSCGASGQVCCSGGSCSSGLACTGGVCQASAPSGCGDPGQTCCTGGMCISGTDCVMGRCAYAAATGCAELGRSCCGGTDCAPQLVCAGGYCGASLAAWDTSINGPNHPVGRRLAFICPPNGSPSTVWGWGTDFYTIDSSVCHAAVHVGRITFTRGGTIVIEVRPGQSSFVGSTRNGVTSASWGANDMSFSVL